MSGEPQVVVVPRPGPSRHSGAQTQRSNTPLPVRSPSCASPNEGAPVQRQRSTPTPAAVVFHALQVAREALSTQNVVGHPLTRVAAAPSQAVEAQVPPVFQRTESVLLEECQQLVHQLAKQLHRGSEACAQQPVVDARDPPVLQRNKSALIQECGLKRLQNLPKFKPPTWTGPLPMPESPEPSPCLMPLVDGQADSESVWKFPNSLEEADVPPNLLVEVAKEVIEDPLCLSIIAECPPFHESSASLQSASLHDFCASIVAASSHESLESSTTASCAGSNGASDEVLDATGLSDTKLVWPEVALGAVLASDSKPLLSPATVEVAATAPAAAVVPTPLRLLSVQRLLSMQPPSVQETFAQCLPISDSASDKLSWSVELVSLDIDVSPSSRRAHWRSQGSTGETGETDANEVPHSCPRCKSCGAIVLPSDAIEGCVGASR